MSLIVNDLYNNLELELDKKMNNQNTMVIKALVGFYNEDEYYVTIEKNQSKYDPFFGEGLLLSGFALRIFSEYENLHTEMLKDFLVTLTAENLKALGKGRVERCLYDPERVSPDDKRVMIELVYDQDQHHFSYEYKGIPDKEEEARIATASFIILLSYLAGIYSHHENYHNYMTEISNLIGANVHYHPVTIYDVEKTSFISTLLPYDNLLNDTPLN